MRHHPLFSQTSVGVRRDSSRFADAPIMLTASGSSDRNVYGLDHDGNGTGCENETGTGPQTPTTPTPTTAPPAPTPTTEPPAPAPEPATPVVAQPDFTG